MVYPFQINILTNEFNIEEYVRLGITGRYKITQVSEDVWDFCGFTIRKLYHGDEEDDEDLSLTNYEYVADPIGSEEVEGHVLYGCDKDNLVELISHEYSELREFIREVMMK